MQRTTLLITLVLLTGCQVPWNAPTVDQGCGNLSLEERDECYYNQALEQSDANLCRNILTIAQRERCFMELAKETCDTTLCDHLKVLYSKENCQQQIENSTHCNVEQPTSEPVSDEQRTEQDIAPIVEESLPGKVEDPNDLCSLLGGDQRDFCYQKSALDAGDSSFCEQVVGERYAGEDVNPAKNKCYFMLAISQCAPVLCNQVQGEQRPFTETSCKQRISQECP